MVPSKDRKRIALCSIIIAMCVKKKRNKGQRSKWCKDWLMKRKHLGSHATILRELEAGNRNDFINYMGMDPNAFHILLARVNPVISKQDTIMRDCITAEARLKATLMFLSTGYSYTFLQYTTRISKQSLSQIIPETCQAIYQVLQEEYLQTPRTPEEWKHVAEDFHSRWNFPNCLGAIDGKHILIRPPHGSGSYFYNYKGSHSIVVMAICDANSEFMYVDVDTNGRLSDGGVWDHSVMSTRIANGTAGLPSDARLPGSERSLPFVFVADDAFPLQRHIMRPFSHRKQSSRERIFSYRVSIARRTVENAFGMLANRFRVLLSPVNLPPDKVEIVVLACTSLYNFLRRDQVNKYTQHEGSLESEELSQGTVVHVNWRTTQELLGLQRVERNPTHEGKRVRQQYMELFTEEGAVPWQDKVTA